jgi:putative polyketide hydroxylase
MLSFEQDPDGVTAVIRDRDSGATQTVRARYMVAADGSRSGIRQSLGIRMLGRGVFSNSVTIYFRAPVAALMRGRNLSVIMVVNPTLRGFFRIEKPAPQQNLWGDSGSGSRPRL